MPISHSIAETAARHPERLALTDTDRRITYRELAVFCARTSVVLERTFTDQAAAGTAIAPPAEANGVPVVALAIEDPLDLARSICAVMTSNAIVTVIDTNWPLGDCVETIRRGAATVVITDRDDIRAGAAQLEAAVEICTVPEFDVRCAAVLQPGEVIVRDDDEPYLLLFTSGTTNKPKGFIKTRAQWRACFPVSYAHFGVADGLVSYVPGSLAYSLTLYGLVEAIGTGGSCIVAAGFEPIDAVRVIREERVDRLVAVPATLRALAVLERRDPGSLASLSWAIVGGANLGPTVRDEFAKAAPHTRLVSYFGAAEIGFLGWSNSGDGTRLRLFDGVFAEVRGPEGEVLPEGELGTLWLRVDAMCVPGYLASTTSVQLRDATGWATVDDQARSFGREVVLAGRAGDVVSTGGHKVALPEIERAFAAIPGYERACAVPLPHKTLGVEVVAVIEPPKQGTTASTAPWPPVKSELLARLRDLLAPQFVPRRFYTVSELPRTVSGKVRRGEVAELIRTDPERFTRL
ncbi:MAG: class I adenylate-forming enzyme family protein [Leucobacter sp.]